MKETKIVLRLTRHERRLLRQLVEACDEKPVDGIAWLEFEDREQIVEKWTRISRSLWEKVWTELERVDEKAQTG